MYTKRATYLSSLHFITPSLSTHARPRAMSSMVLRSSSANRENTHAFCATQICNTVCKGSRTPGHMRSFYDLPSYFCKIHFYIILPSMPHFPQAISFPWVLPTRALYAFIFSPYVSLAPPSHSSCFDLSGSIFCGVKIMRRLFMPFCPVFC